MDNLEEMDKFLETCNLALFNQEKIENPNRPVTCKEIKAMRKIVQTNKQTKNIRPGDITGEFYEMIKEDLTLLLLKLFPKKKNEEEETL